MTFGLTGKSSHETRVGPLGDGPAALVLVLPPRARSWVRLVVSQRFA